MDIMPDEIFIALSQLGFNEVFVSHVSH